jgi:N-acetylglucosamine kinase-like BadF-type ATPase
MEGCLHYYIGVDGGATKTAFCAASIESPVLRYAETSGSSWREKGILEVAQMFKKTIADFMGEDKKNIAGIAMGLPCYGESIEGDRLLKQAINDAFPSVPVYLTNDVEVGWAGSLALAPGINIISGTGAIAFGRDIHGKTARSGGWSEFFSDEGSCYWIGRKVMELFSKQSDGRMPRDALHGIVNQEFNLENDFDFIDVMHSEYINNRKQVASMQLLAEKAAMAGSSSVKALYDEAVKELLLLVTAIRNQLDFGEEPWAVSYSGGLFKAAEFVLPQFFREIEKAGGKVSQPLFTPVEGAVLLAIHHFNQGALNQIKNIMENKGEKQ